MADYDFEAFAQKTIANRNSSSNAGKQAAESMRSAGISNIGGKTATASARNVQDMFNKSRDRRRSGARKGLGGSPVDKKEEDTKSAYQKVKDLVTRLIPFSGGSFTNKNKETDPSKLYGRSSFIVPLAVGVNFGSSMGTDPNDPRGREQRALPQNTYQSTINTFLTGGGRDDFVKGSSVTPRGLMSPPTMDQPATPDMADSIDRVVSSIGPEETAAYKIQSGDTLGEIADATGTTVSELKRLNGIENENLIFAGEDINIPIRRLEDKEVVTKANSMEELKPIKASFVADSTDPDSQYYESFKEGVTPIEMLQTTGDDTYVSADYMSELEILARTIEAEAGGESKKGKLAVGAVIKNRADQNRFGTDIRSVILFPSQFSPWNKYTSSQGGKQGKDMLGEKMKPSKDSYDAAKKILSGNYVDPTFGASHFVNPKISKPSWYKGFKENGTTKIGKHEFGDADRPLLKPKGLGAK